MTDSPNDKGLSRRVVVDEDKRRLWVHRFVALVVVLIAWVAWLFVKLLEPAPHPNWSLPFVSISVPAQVAFRAYYLLGIAWFIQLHFSLRRAGRAVLDLGHKRVFLMVTPTREDRTWKTTFREILYTVFWLSTMWWFGVLLNISIKKVYQNGLWLHGSLVSWKRVRSWEWGEGYDVILRVRPMWWSLFTVVKVPVPDEDREPLEALLREHAPKGR